MNLSMLPKHIKEKLSVKKYSDYACNTRNSYTFSLYILLPSRFCSEQLTKHMQDFNLKWFSTKDVCTHCKLIKIPGLQ